jgi:hypothetical protein
MRRSTQLSILILTAALLAVAPGAAHAESRCLTAEVPMPVVLPDGSVHDSGAVRLCVTGRLNPVADFHKIQFEGRAIGEYAGRKIDSEAPLGRPYMIFHRSANGELILIGYARPPRSQGERGITVMLTEQVRLDLLIAEGEARWEQNRLRALQDEFAVAQREAEDPVVMVAAASR